MGVSVMCRNMYMQITKHWQQRLSDARVPMMSSTKKLMVDMRR
jgi:hypothetical protein